MKYASPSLYHFVLHQADLLFPKLKALNKRRVDEAMSNQRMAEIWSEAAEDFSGDDTVFFASGEVGVVHEAVPRKFWYTRREEEAVGWLEAAGAKLRRVLQQDSRSVELFELDWHNADMFIDALDQIGSYYPGGLFIGRCRTSFR